MTHHRGMDGCQGLLMLQLGSEVYPSSGILRRMAMFRGLPDGHRPGLPGPPGPPVIRPFRRDLGVDSRRSPGRKPDDAGGCPKNGDRWWLKWLSSLWKNVFFFSWINVDGGLPVYLCSVQDVGARHVRYYCIIIYIYMCIHIHIYIYVCIHIYIMHYGMLWHMAYLHSDHSKTGWIRCWTIAHLRCAHCSRRGFSSSFGVSWLDTAGGKSWGGVDYPHAPWCWNIYQHFP